MSNASLNNFALRLVNSKIDSSKFKGLNEEEAAMQAHIVGIFVSLDTDRDGLITRPQLTQGVQLLGLRPTKQLLGQFSTDPPVQRRASVTSQPLISPEERLKQSKVDADTFCRVMLDEWRKVRSTIDQSLDTIFAFACDNDKIANVSDDAVLNAVALHHIMQKVEVPTKLSDKDFHSFLELLPKDADGSVRLRDVKKVLFH